MKKAIFFPPSCSTTKENEFESCRGEGRAVMNIAFGFALLGYECYIINNWNITSPRKIWENVYISNKPDENVTYNIALTFDDYNIINRKNYKHKLLMNYSHSDKIYEYIKKNNLDIIIVCPLPTIMEKSPFHKKYSKFLGTIYPLPRINIGFIPYKFNPKLPELKIYLYHSSWKDSVSSISYSGGKQLIVLDFLKSKGYDLNLFIHVESEESAKQAFLDYDLSKHNKDKIHYIYNEKTRYDDLIKILQEVDLCITARAGYDSGGSSIGDIISLGKPLIYIVTGPPHNDFILNPLYMCPKYMIIRQENYHESYRKLEELFPNKLEESFNCYRDSLKDLDFNLWKSHAEKLLKELGEL